MGCNRDRKSEKTRGQTLHLLYNSSANNGQERVGFLINTKLVDHHIVKVNSINVRTCYMNKTRYKLNIWQVYAPTTSYPEEDINSFYNGVDETLEKLIHYTMAMGDFNAQIGKRTNAVEAVTDTFGLELEKETLVKWATS